MALVPGGDGRRGRCLGPELTAYADRAMDADSLRRWDRHLVACTSCRAAVDSERRVLASLRAPAAPSVPGELRGMLLALAAAIDPEPGRGPAGPAVPPVPVAPVPVVDRGMPAFHRSARRATMFAGLAAGATAAAAWSIAFTGAASVSHPAPATSPGAVQPGRPATPGYATAAFTVSTLGLTSGGAFGRSATFPVGPRPDVNVARVRSAESTP